MGTWGAMPRLVSVNVNAERQFRKVPQTEAQLVADFGLRVIGMRDARGVRSAS
jgi:hypothetical protein